MLVPLIVKKFTFEEFEKYSKENDMWWIIKDGDYKDIRSNHLIKFIGEEYGINKIDPDKKYSFIICDKYSFLIDVDENISKDIDNDKYEYHVYFDTTADELYEELSDIVSYDENTKVNLSIAEWSYITRYHIATYYKDTGRLELSTDNNINRTRILFTAFRVNKETREYDRIYFDQRNKQLKLGPL